VRELARLGLGLDVQDAVEILARLKATDFSARLLSEHTGEWLYVFKPSVAGMVI